MKLCTNCGHAQPSEHPERCACGRSVVFQFATGIPAKPATIHPELPRHPDVRINQQREAGEQGPPFTDPNC